MVGAIGAYVELLSATSPTPVLATQRMFEPNPGRPPLCVTTVPSVGWGSTFNPYPYPPPRCDHVPVVAERSAG